MKRNNISIISAALCALILSGCGGNSEPIESAEPVDTSDTAETTELSETAAAEEVTEAAEEEAVPEEEDFEEEYFELYEGPEEEETFAVTEVSEGERESESQSAAHVYTSVAAPGFILYEPEVREGVPAVCDIDAILAGRRNDFAEKGTDWRRENDPDPDEIYDRSIYPDAVTFAEKYYKYSFDSSDPVKSYIEDDFDLDGKNEYYLCLAEYVMVRINEEYKQYATAIVTSLYYIDDDGTYKNAFSSLVPMSVPEALSGDTAEEALNSHLEWCGSDRNLRFEIERGYGDYLAPVVIDYGDSKHLFWKNDDSYPADYGAEIFWLDKHCRAEISAPSASLGGFYEWGGKAENVFYNERENFGDDFWATTVNLASFMDLYTNPEINGKVNTMTWDGSNYVYNIISDPFDNLPESGPIEWD